MYPYEKLKKALNNIKTVAELLEKAKSGNLTPEQQAEIDRRVQAARNPSSRAAQMSIANSVANPPVEAKSNPQAITQDVRGAALNDHQKNMDRLSAEIDRIDKDAESRNLNKDKHPESWDMYQKTRNKLQQLKQQLESKASVKAETKKYDKKEADKKLKDLQNVKDTAEGAGHLSQILNTTQSHLDPSHPAYKYLADAAEKAQQHASTAEANKNAAVASLAAEGETAKANLQQQKQEKEKLRGVATPSVAANRNRLIDDQIDSSNPNYPHLDPSERPYVTPVATKVGALSGDKTKEDVVQRVASKPVQSQQTMRVRPGNENQGYGQNLKDLAQVTPNDNVNVRSPEYAAAQDKKARQQAEAAKVNTDVPIARIPKQK